MKSPCPDVGIYRCIRAVESIIDADTPPPSPYPYAGIKNNTHIVWVWL